MQLNTREQELEQEAFQLKHEGAYEKALHAYAYEYRNAMKNEDEYIGKVCFDQMFDCCLLFFLQQHHRFSNKAEVIEGVKQHLIGVFQESEIFNKHGFQQHFSEARRQLTDGRRKSSFSVDAKQLLKDND